MVHTARDLKKLFREKGILHTAQREIIARTLFSIARHVGAEELYDIVVRKHPQIGLATVYRTLNLFAEKQLIDERQFGDGWKRYEHSHDTHHDHLICLGCGRVVEFEDPGIERLQAKVALAHDFIPVKHRMVLYGHCPDCRKKGESGVD